MRGTVSINLGCSASSSEGAAQLGDRYAQALVKIDENVVRPEAVAKFLAGNNFAIAFEEGEQTLEGLILKFDHAALTEEVPLAVFTSNRPKR